MDEKIRVVRDYVNKRVKNGSKLYTDSEIEARFTDENIKTEDVVLTILKDLRGVFMIRKDINPTETNQEIKNRLVEANGNLNDVFKHYLIVNKIAMVRRQIETDDTDEQVKERLIAKNGDVMEVLREYMGIEREKRENPDKSISTNQLIYKEIRTFLDGVSRR